MLSQVVISQVRSRISWNVLSPNTIVSSAIQIDGVTVASVSGPFAASSGVNFSVALGSLVAGSHSYRITATDNLGRQSALLANFNLTAATSAAVAAAQNAVFSSLADSTLANSAKVDGLFAAVPTDSLTSGLGNKRCVSRRLSTTGAAGRTAFPCSCADWACSVAKSSSCGGRSLRLPLPSGFLKRPVLLSLREREGEPGSLHAEREEYIPSGTLTRRGNF